MLAAWNPKDIRAVRSRGKAWTELAGNSRSIASTGRDLLKIWDQSLDIGHGHSPIELLTNGKKKNREGTVFKKRYVIF